MDRMNKNLRIIHNKNLDSMNYDNHFNFLLIPFIQVSRIYDYSTNIFILLQFFTYWLTYIELNMYQNGHIYGGLQA